MTEHEAIEAAKRDLEFCTKMGYATSGITLEALRLLLERATRPHD